MTRRPGPLDKPICPEVLAMAERFIKRCEENGYAVVRTETPDDLTVWATKTDNQQERECQQIC